MITVKPGSLWRGFTSQSKGAGGEPFKILQAGGGQAGGVEKW